MVSEPDAGAVRVAEADVDDCWLQPVVPALESVPAVTYKTRWPPPDTDKLMDAPGVKVPPSVKLLAVSKLVEMDGVTPMIEAQVEVAQLVKRPHSPTRLVAYPSTPARRTATRAMTDRRITWCSRARPETDG